MNRLRTGVSYSRAVLSPSKTQPKGTIDGAVLSLVPSVLRCPVSQRPQYNRPKENNNAVKPASGLSCESKLPPKSPKVPASLVPVTSSSVDAAPQANLCSLFSENNVDFLSQVDWKVSSSTGQPASLEDRSTAASEYFSSKQKADDAEVEKQMRRARIQGYAKQRQYLVKKLFEETDPAKIIVLTSQLSAICKAQQEEECEYRLCVEPWQHAKSRHSSAKLRYQEMAKMQSDGYLPDVTGSSGQIACPVYSSSVAEESFLQWSSNNGHRNPLRAALEAIMTRKDSTCKSQLRATSKAPTLTSSIFTPAKSILRSSFGGRPSKESCRSRVAFCPASEIKTKYFVPPLEAEGVKDPQDRLKAHGNFCHQRGPITAQTLYSWSQSDDVNKTARFTSFLGSASLREVARAFHYGEFSDDSLDSALALLMGGGFLDNPECQASVIYMEGSVSQKRAHLKQLIGLLPLLEA